MRVRARQLEIADNRYGAGLVTYLEVATAGTPRSESTLRHAPPPAATGGGGRFNQSTLEAAGR